MKKIICLILWLNSVLLSQAQVCQQIKDINAGAGSGNPGQFHYVNSKILFSASGSSGEELYVTDGTSGGTTLVKEVNPSGSAFNGTIWAILNDKAYFLLDDGVHGMELWASDGTNAGTLLIKDINTSAGVGQEASSFMFTFNGKIYFAANDGTNGIELWSSDGTAGGTSMVKDINSSGDGVYKFVIPIVFNNEFYFPAASVSGNYQLWKSDGTSAGTVLVKDINPSGNGLPYYFTEFNSKLYFCADDGTNGRELWVTDGTGANTTMVKDINPGINGGVTSYVMGATSAGLFFVGDNGTDGGELWITDGTSSGTVQVKNINTSASAGMGLSKAQYVIINDVFYFAATDGGTYGKELWKSDGTSGGTVMIKDIRSSGDANPYSFCNLNGRLLFAANDGTGTGWEPWISDGTSGGTTILQDLNSTGSSDPNDYTLINGVLYFSADNGVDGTELWIGSGGVISAVDKNSETKSINYFPNPTQKDLTVQFDSFKDVKKIQVQDLLGEVKYEILGSEESPSSFTIDLSEIPQGAYLLVLQDHQQNKVVNKFIKY